MEIQQRILNKFFIVFFLFNFDLFAVRTMSSELKRMELAKNDIKETSVFEDKTIEKIAGMGRPGELLTRLEASDDNITREHVYAAAIVGLNTYIKDFVVEDGKEKNDFSIIKDVRRLQSSKTHRATISGSWSNKKKNPNKLCVNLLPTRLVRKADAGAENMLLLRMSIQLGDEKKWHVRVPMLQKEFLKNIIGSRPVKVKVKPVKDDAR